MNLRKKSQLKKELAELGVTSSEADKLADFAKELGAIKPKGLSAATKARLAPEPEVAEVHHELRWAMAGGFAAILILVGVAQSALPGSWLYGVKRTTEETRAVVQPSYNDNLVEKRQEELQQLEQQKAAPAQLEQAEKNYEDALKKSLQRRQNQQNSTDSRLQQWQEWYKQYQEQRNNRQNDTQNKTQSFKPSQNNVQYQQNYWYNGR